MSISSFQRIDKAQGSLLGILPNVISDGVVNVPIGLFTRDNWFRLHYFVFGPCLLPVCTRLRSRLKYAASATDVGREAAPAKRRLRNCKRS